MGKAVTSTIENDLATMRQARAVADSMQVLAEARAGDRTLRLTDVRDLVRWALVIEQTAGAGERMGEALKDVATIGGLAQLRGEQVAGAMVTQMRRAIEEYPDLFAEYPLLTELRKMVTGQ